MSDLVPLPAPRSTPYGMLRAAPFAGDEALPEHSEVVIVGGGICGIMTAYFLAKRGVPVLVCEKAEIGCESSSRAFGWVSELMLDPGKVELTRESSPLWAELQADGVEAGYRRDGLTMLADSAEELAFFEGWLETVRGIGAAGNRILTSAQVRDRLPGITQDFAGALFGPEDGSAEPVIATAAVAEAARRAGARIVTGCAVRGLDLQGGRVAGVYTERGRVATGTVLCAANIWSRLFCGNHGIDIPQLYVIMTLGRTGPTDGPPGAGGQTTWGWRRQIDGTYSLGGITGVEMPITRDALLQYRRFRPLMKMQPFRPDIRFGKTSRADFGLRRRWDPKRGSPFEKCRVLPSDVRGDIAAESLRKNREIFPAMANAELAETWSGAVTFTPDEAPIVGPVQSLPGLHLLTGCSYGISWAPALGRMMADIMTGATPTIDPRPYRLERFFDGTPSGIAAH